MFRELYETGDGSDKEKHRTRAGVGDMRHVVHRSRVAYLKDNDEENDDGVKVRRVEEGMRRAGEGLKGIQLDQNAARVSQTNQIFINALEQLRSSGLSVYLLPVYFIGLNCLLCKNHIIRL
ncbi:hypothetical protein J6590_006561 [Homalodisca vitripennis]|nr:hypothetical protein J6590_006561 [Homalodisca vitripennis]